MRKFLLVLAATVAAALSWAFIDGKPSAKACSGGPVDLPTPTDTGSSGPSYNFYGAKHGKDGAMGS